MTHLSNQSDLPTDAYPTAPSTPVSENAGQRANYKKKLGISAAAMLLGGAAWSVADKSRDIVTGKTDTDTDTDSDSDSDSHDTTNTGMALNPDIDAAGKVDDSMSFEQAFGVARDEVGMGGVFSWHGRWYNTFNAQEWNSLSLEQRQQFTEIILDEHLPVKPYGAPVVPAAQTVDTTSVDKEPTIIEGHLNGQRVMGLDFDQDGIIDTLVMEGADGYTYKVVDASGDDGLDTLFRYDSLNGELVEMEKIDEPIVLSNDDFTQGLEERMSKEVVDSILEPDASVPASPDTQHETTADEVAPDEDHHIADAHEVDDTYVNNGDVQDMDE